MALRYVLLFIAVLHFIFVCPFQAVVLLLVVQCAGHLLPCAVGVQQTQSSLHCGVQEENTSPHLSWNCQVGLDGSRSNTNGFLSSSLQKVHTNSGFVVASLIC